ncbi:MAG: hypothetical protein F4002_02610 [Chromatiales bacterium]|nr:hypothetical protein [Chromatiales bacterium]
MVPGREGVPPSKKARTPSSPGRTRKLSVSLALLALAPIASTQEADTPLTNFFATTQHLQADFTQLEYDGDGIFQKESTGRLYLSRPGRFRLDYLEPDELMIWADGENLSMFDKELEQVTVYTQTEQLRESAAALLAGDASVLESYEVKEAEFDDGLQWFDLTGADAEEGDLRLALRGSVPAVLEFADDLGSRVRMLLFRLDLDSELDDDVFAPTIPPGVDIFEAAET